MKLHVNGQLREVPDDWADETLAVVLREPLQLVGTKLGCGTGACGCCVVQVDGHAVRSCMLSARQVQQAAITTLEGLSATDGPLHPVQQAWLDEGVSQCGFCQGGQVMALAAAWDARPPPDAAALLRVLDGHACRCGTQARARRAVLRLLRVRAPTGLP